MKMHQPSMSERKLVRAPNTPNILDFGKTVLGIDLNLSIWKDENEQTVWFSAQEIASLLAITQGSITSLSRKIPQEFAITDGVNVLSDDAVLQMLFSINTPFTRVFKKFVKFVLIQLYSTGTTSLQDAKEHVRDELGDLQANYDAVTADRNYLEQLHCTDVDEIQRLKFRIMELKSAQPYIPTRDEQYTAWLEANCLRPFECHALPYTYVLDYAADADVDVTDIPAYDEIDSTTTCYISFDKRNVQTQLLGTVYARSRIQVLKTLRSSGLPRVYIGEYENVVYGVRKQLLG